jgi:hypothetical protein
VAPLVVAAGIWAAAELGLSAYDIYDFFNTVTDSCATTRDKMISAAGLGAGVFLPGAGYGIGLKTIKNGDLIHREYKTASGIVEILGEARVRGDVLKIKDIAIYPKGADKLQLSPKEINDIKNQLINEVSSQGYRRLRITGHRVSGANPGKNINIKLNLEK